MPINFREIRLRSLVGGLLSYIPGLYYWWDNRRPTGNTASSKYARSIWEFHRDNFERYSKGRRPLRVAELGPGATLATCIAALCDGVDTAVGLDVCPYAGGNQNQKMLDELWPKSGDRLRYEEIRDAIHRLGRPQEKFILAYFAPWTDSGVLPEASVDMVFSHSVLEHVDSPGGAYAACFKWLRPGGIMSHKIDHSSHGFTHSWNGHYALPNWIWSLFRGGRPYLLNRMTPSHHRDLILAQGFEILSETLVESTNFDKSTRCALSISDSDARVKTSTFICKKPLGPPDGLLPDSIFML